MAADSGPGSAAPGGSGRVEALCDIARVLEDGDDEQVEGMLSRAARLLGLEIGIVSRIEEDAWIVEHFHAPSREALSRGEQFPLTETYCSVVWKADEAVAIDRMSRSEHRTHPAWGRFGLESYVGVPLRVEGRRHGTLSFASPEPREVPFLPEDVQTVQLLGKWLERTLELRRVRQRLAEAHDQLALLAATDELTGLPNQRTFKARLKEELERSRRYGAAVTVALVGIDRLDEIRAGGGDEAADLVVGTVADTVRQVCRATDLVSRFGEGQIGVLMPSTPLGRAATAAERMRRSVAGVDASSSGDSPSSTGDGPAATSARGSTDPSGSGPAVTVSIGVGVPHEGEKLEAFLRRVDEAVQAARVSGSDQVFLAAD